MAKLLEVKKGDKIVYADCKANRGDFIKDHTGIVIGKIYVVNEDFAGDVYVETKEGRCYANIYSGWAHHGKATKIID